MIRSGLAMASLLTAAAVFDARAQDVVFADSFESAPAAALTERKAAEFLARATFGPDDESIDELVSMGLEAWIDAQLALPPSLHRPPLEARANNNLDVYQGHRVDQWWTHAVYGRDQLRQRMAFALSQILVISDQSGALEGSPIPMAEYYDILVRGAFGNYRDLLEDVTLNPMMGQYLAMFKNQKPVPEEGIRPDENYAREIMQLFTIGLEELESDGTPMLAAGEPIPTYGQADIVGLAHVFTGWNYSGIVTCENWWEWVWPDPTPMVPMEACENYHDTGPKTIIAGTPVPANGSAAEDLAIALDTLFNHPNVGPFLARQLIQRLVTSNPSPDYVARVAAVFDNNGNNVRGDLGAVARAILTDSQALDGYSQSPENFGKLREPLIRITHMWRVLDAYHPSGTLSFGWVGDVINQGPLSSPTVFNFYRPDYLPPGEMTDLNLAGPEFQITDENYLTEIDNLLFWLLRNQFEGAQYLSEDMPVHRLSPLVALLDDPDALIEQVNLLFVSGQMTDQMKTVLRDYLAGVWSGLSNEQRVGGLLYLTLTSAEYVIQK